MLCPLPSFFKESIMKIDPKTGQRVTPEEAKKLAEEEKAKGDEK